MSIWGENSHTRWECSYQMRMSICSENVHGKWGCPCEVTFQMVQGTPHHTLECDLACTQGENIHTRWECPHDMKMPTQSENAHVMWLFRCNMSHLVKFFIPWYFVLLVLISKMYGVEIYRAILIHFFMKYQPITFTRKHKCIFCSRKCGSSSYQGLSGNQMKWIRTENILPIMFCYTSSFV